MVLHALLSNGIENRHILEYLHVQTYFEEPFKPITPLRLLFKTAISRFVAVQHVIVCQVKYI